jgi:hypothetical protein
MTLFSWFIQSTKIKTQKNDKTSLEQELTTFNNNTMWPIAKVRNNTVVKQQEYINSSTQLKDENPPLFKEQQG